MAKDYDDKGNLEESQPEPDQVRDQEDESMYASDLDYVRDAKFALVSESPSHVRSGLMLIAVTIFFGIVWAYFAEIDEVVNVVGKVVPTQQLQVLQNLEGGIIDKIKVDEGDKVKAGQVLVTLDSIRWKSDYNRDLTRQAVLEAEILRLRAEINGDKSPVFPDAFRQKYPEVVQDTNRLFQSHQTALKEKLDVLENNYRLAKEELDIIMPLAKEGVMSKVDLLRLERQVSAMEGDIQAAKDQARNDASDRLNVVLADKKVLDESIDATRDRLIRSDIRAPVDGIVNQIYVSTQGEVIRSGQRILDIVPENSKLTIQGRVKPNEIGFIKPGQHAVIKVTAFSFARYGGIDGEVTSISPDSLADEQGNLYYEIKLQANKMYVGDETNKMYMTSGMTVNANVTVGKKTVLEYIMKPFIVAKEEAFKEG